MEKYIVQFLLLIPYIVFAEPLVLNKDNLTLFALKNSNETIVDKYSIYLAKTQYSQKYFKYKAGTTQRTKLIEKTKKELTKKIKAFPIKPQFVYKKQIKLTPKSDTGYHLKGFSTGTVLPIHRGDTAQAGLPNFYKILISNLEIVNNIKSEAILLSNDSKKASQAAYIEAKIELLKYQNMHDFQAVISSFELYTDKSKQDKIATIKETRETETIINNWLLSDGFTNNLAGIHAYSVYGHRLQDSIRNTLTLNNQCNKTERINNHQVLECNLPYSENILLKTHYLGGRLAQFQLIVQKQTTDSERSKVIKLLSNSLRNKPAFFDQESRIWKKHQTEFEFHPNAFDFAKNIPSNYQGKLLFKMFSTATRDLINP